MRQISISSGLAALLLTVLVGLPIVVFSRALFRSATLVLNEHDINDVVLGKDIVLDIDNVPDGWSGAVTVNSAQRFRFQQKRFRVSATVENGFKRDGMNDLMVMLADRNGAAIPIRKSDGHYFVATVPHVTVSPEFQLVDAEANSRAIIVKDRLGYRWVVTGQPAWIAIASGLAGTEDDKIDYDVQKNTTNEPRGAKLRIGDATFEIQQRAPVTVQIPYRETFSAHVPPSPIWMLDKRDRGEQVESPSRWFLDEQPGRKSTVTFEASGPSGSDALVVRSAEADTRSWATQLDLPQIAVEPRHKYVLSLFLKAEVAGPVSISFTQRTAPYQDCGLFQTVAVTTDWSAFTLPFRVTGMDCGSKNNRLSIGTGRIAGKLSIAKVSLERARPE
jgi:hypothetical protein